MNMISYKNVKKFKYERNSADVVALREYIIYQDAKDGKKYALLNFYNNLNQQLYGIKFEILQYDGGGNLLSKTLLLHDKFTAAENDSFVPQAKVKLSENCESISYNLIAATFDRVKWEKGEFTDNSYEFERYVDNAGLNNEVRQVETVDTAKPEKKKRRKEKIPKNGFVMHSVMRKNAAAFPKVFAVFAAILLICGALASSLYIRFTTKRYEIDDFIVQPTGESTIAICGYEGKSTDVIIPSVIDGRTVTRIAQNAFSNSYVKNVVISAARVTVDKKAFYGSKLETIKGDGDIRLLSDSLGKCAYLKTVDLPFGSVSQYAFEESFAKSQSLNIKIPTLSENAFGNCPKLASLEIEANTVTAKSLTGLGGLVDLAIDANISCNNFILLLYPTVNDCKPRTFGRVRIKNMHYDDPFFDDCEKHRVVIQQFGSVL